MTERTYTPDQLRRIAYHIAQTARLVPLESGTEIHERGLLVFICIDLDPGTGKRHTTIADVWHPQSGQECPDLRDALQLLVDEFT